MKKLITIILNIFTLISCSDQIPNGSRQKRLISQISMVDSDKSTLLLSCTISQLTEEISPITVGKPAESQEQSDQSAETLVDDINVNRTLVPNSEGKLVFIRKNQYGKIYQYPAIQCPNDGKVRSIYCNHIEKCWECKPLVTKAKNERKKQKGKTKYPYKNREAMRKIYKQKRCEKNRAKAIEQQDDCDRYLSVSAFIDDIQCPF